MPQYVEEREGAYYIAGTRIALDSIIGAFKAGESPENILRSFPLAGPLVRIYGAITFYLEKQRQGRSVPERSGTALERNGGQGD
jgi:uncharacterized protein (DUF433 family)